MPVGPYPDFETCIRKNRDKRDPAAFCGYLEKRTADTDETFPFAAITDSWIIADVQFDSDLQAQEAERLVREKKMAGISADIGNVTASLEVLEQDEFGEPTDWLETITEGEIIGATQLAMPAFADAQIVEEEGQLRVYVVPEGVVTSDRRFIRPGALTWRDPAPLMFIDRTTRGHSEAVFVGNLTNFRRTSQPDSQTAAGVWQPPRGWFELPEPDQPTPLTVTDQGQVFGHLAEWHTCHIAFDACVTAPQSASNYSVFHTAQTQTAEGDMIRVGHITVNTGHADQQLKANAAAAHYDHTGHAVADIRAVDGKLGIWVCGAIRPSASDEQIQVLTRSVLSGDWRRIDGNLELVAALAVNVPGFPVARVASGEQLSLVAAGIVADPRDEIIELLSAEILKLREQVDELRKPALLEKARDLAARFDR